MNARVPTGNPAIDCALLAGEMRILHLGVDASGGAANVTGLSCAAGVPAAGDRLRSAIDLTDLTDVTASFATAANDTGSISQLNTNLSAKKILFFFLPIFHQV